MTFILNLKTTLTLKNLKTQVWMVEMQTRLAKRKIKKTSIMLVCTATLKPTPRPAPVKRADRSTSLEDMTQHRDNKRYHQIPCAASQYPRPSAEKRTGRSASLEQMTEQRQPKLQLSHQDDDFNLSDEDEESESSDTDDEEFVAPDTGVKRTSRSESFEALTEKRRSKRTTMPPQAWWQVAQFTHFAASVGDHLPKTYKAAMESGNAGKWSEACKAEIKSLLENKTWDVVELPEGRKAIGASGCSKSRKGPMGYSQEYGIDYEETFEPVAKFTAIRVLLSTAAKYNIDLQQMDVNTAFLNSDLDEDIYMQVPDGLDVKATQGQTSKLVLKLKKSVYGLKQAPRLWNETIDGIMLSIGFIKSNAIIASTSCELEAGSYWPEAEQVHVSNDAVGCLMYLMVATRPDIAVAVGVASQFLENPGQQHWSAVKCIFRYLKGTEDFGIEYSGSQDVCGYTDADWAGDTDTRHSTNGYCFMPNNGIVGWKSRKQRTVALSSTEAEYMGLSEASQEAVWMKRLLLDLDEVDVKTPIVVWEDNQGSIALAKNPQHHNRTKHIDIRYHFVGEKVQDQDIALKYCPTQNMIADIFTKTLPTVQLHRLRTKMGVKQAHHDLSGSIEKANQGYQVSQNQVPSIKSRSIKF
ncbi:hypothetical protein LEN26_007465 [Aphanomyces euteiches]|nr:hypothetical protein LEN26_007465 [Aphanomyces euteiches]